MSGAFFEQVAAGIPDALPPFPIEDPRVPRAPARRIVLTAAERRLALANALRYFPPSLHDALAPEFARELLTDGHIYTTISLGRGRMPNYSRITPEDRWNVVNYVRELNGGAQ